MSTATMSPPRKSKSRELSVVLTPEPEFVIHTPKKAALIQLNNLNDDVSWEEIFDYLELRKELEESCLEVNQGLLYTHEEVRAEFEARWRQ